MSEKINILTQKYTNREISFSQLKEEMRNDIKNKQELESLFEVIISNKDSKCLEIALYLLWDLEEEQEFIYILHRLLLEKWHTRYEEIIHDLQNKANPISILYIKTAMQEKYEYLESYGTGTRQFINQCGHALWSIGTTESIDVIRELSNSNDPILKDEMLYRIDQIDGINEYERNYDL
ncbi:MAG: hypothetical protein GY754_31540 [bacterium]|nr:hypothetical protein [bacterium]